MQKMYDDGDDQGLASALKSIIDEGSALANARAVPIPTMELDSRLELEDIPNSQVVEYYQPELMKQIMDRVQDAIQTLEAAKHSYQSNQSHRMLKSKAQDRKRHNPTSPPSNIPVHSSPRSNIFDNDFAEPLSSITTASLGSEREEYNHESSGGHSNERYSGFNNKVSFEKVMRQARAAAHSRMPDFGKLIHSTSDADDSSNRRLRVLEKHQRRTEALEVCRPKVDINDSTSNCQKLVGCIEDMTDYDLALLFVEGYVETNPDNENFANFTANINLFDAHFDILGKIGRIREYAADLSNCGKLLSELHSPCNPLENSCSDPNKQSFQLSIDDVCDAVNTPVKLLLSSISEKMDGNHSRKIFCIVKKHALFHK